MDSKILIFDYGSGYCKLGYSGDLKPKIISPTLAGVDKSENIDKFSKENLKFGDDIDIDEDNLIFPIQKGMIADWDVFETYLGYILKEMKVDPKNQGIFIIENPLTKKNHRERLTQLLFEKFEFPSMFIINNAILSLCGAFKYSGLSVDCGYDFCQVVPIKDGYIFQSAIKTLDIGGKDIEERLLNLLIKKGYEKKNINKHIRDMMEKHCYIKYEDENMSKENYISVEVDEYKLPDGSTVQLEEEKYKCTEILYHPEEIKNEIGGLHQIFCSSLYDVEHITKKKKFEINAVLNGGITMFRNFKLRFQEEVEKFYGRKYKGKVDVVDVDEKRNLVWLGGSFFSIMKIFKGLCTTKEDYDKNGSGIINNTIFY